MFKKLLLVSFIFLTNVSVCLSQTTSETEISKILIQSNNIISQKEYQYMPEIIDYSIEILKMSPNSLSAYFATGYINATIAAPKETKVKLKEMYDKYFSSIDNIDSNIIEKIILAELFDCGHSIVDNITYEEALISHEIGRKILNNIRENCSNKDYAALAMLCLISNASGSIETIELCEKFLNFYPDHKAVPLILANIISEKYLFNSESKDYLKYIEEIKKFIDKNNNLYSPFGNYKLSIDYYPSLTGV